MSVSIEFTPAAAEQVEAAAQWWRENRPSAPDLFESELASAIALLAESTPLTQVFAEVDGKLVRKIRLPRTHHALYFTVEGDVVTVHALWHGARGSGPPLP